MRVLSLFSGAGGMDLGMEGGFPVLRKSLNPALHPDWVPPGTERFVELPRTGFETIFANDIRADAKAAWEGFFGGCRDVTGVYHLESVVELVRQAQAGETVFPEDIDVVTGGFPCNDFSVAGKRRGFASAVSDTGERIDPDAPSVANRGQLYIWMRDVIALTRPRVFLAENVKGLTNLGNARQIIEHDFAAADGDGYLVVPAQVLRAWEYGVPQSRERVIFIGFRKSALRPEALDALSWDPVPEAFSPYPLRTHGPGLCPFVTCQDALSDLPEPDAAADPSQRVFSHARYLGIGCQGQTEIRLDAIGPTIRAEHHGNIEFRRLSAEHGGTHTAELEAGLPERRLTVRECARIQTFPDCYRFVRDKGSGGAAISASSAYRLIGNAVPPLLAYHLADNLKRKWNLYFR